MVVETMRSTRRGGSRERLTMPGLSDVVEYAIIGLLVSLLFARRMIGYLSGCLPRGNSGIHPIDYTTFFIYK